MIIRLDFNKFSEVRDKIALLYWNRVFADFQKEISDAILKACIDKFYYRKDVDDIYIAVSRQAGKTETICCTTRIIDLFLPHLLQYPFFSGIFSPTQEQTKTDVDRNDARMKPLWNDFRLKKLESNAKTIRIGDNEANEMATTFCFSLAPTTSNESKTLHLAIFEESQKIDDEKAKNEANPMLTSTNGLRVYIGTGGYRNCDFKKALDEGKNVYIYNADRVIADYNKLYRQTGNDFYLNYGKFLEREIIEYGKDSDYIQTQYFLKFITERGNMVTKHKLYSCREKPLEYNDEPVEIGIDWGKMHDRTVVTAVDYDFRIRDWMVLKGDDYTTQIPLIVDWVEEQRKFNVQKYKCDSTGNQDTNRELLRDQANAPVEGVCMTLQTKSEMYKQFLRAIETQDGKTKLKYPADHPHTKDFERETLDMEKEYKGTAGYLSCHHPDTPNAHDDFPDSVAVALYNLKQPFLKPIFV